QAGTLSGNPLAMTAGATTLRLLRSLQPYPRLEALGRRLAEGLTAAAGHFGVPLVLNRVGSMLTPFFSADPVTDFASASRSDTRRYAAFFRKMLERGVYLPPAQYEAWFLSAAHSEADVERTVEAAGRVFEDLSAETEGRHGRIP